MKKKMIAIVLLLILSVLVVPTKAEAASRVRGYVKKNGTYVAPHYKSTPDKSKFNNYSTKGNINPYSGKKGTVDPFKIPKKKY